jgi:hypothetical protein
LRSIQRPEGSFDKNVEALHKRKVVSDECKAKLDEMWAERNSFHRLRPSVESDQKKLEEKARNNLTLLNKTEQAFFSAAQ